VLAGRHFLLGALSSVLQPRQLIESLLKYLAQVEESQGTNFGTVITAGALADQKPDVSGPTGIVCAVRFESAGPWRSKCLR
jgi:hypothetical protein